jgi:RNA polymerase sigma-70 factor (ECF subfamily)
MPLSPETAASHAAIERTFRQETGQVLATLIGWLGDFQAAEDALQDAFVSALEHWPRDGVPARPGAWMTQVARRKAIDRLRRGAGREHSGLEHLPPALLASEPGEPDEYPDERLKLICTCCHPALPLEGQVALTLHTLGGLTTAEIASAFLVPVATMAQRLVRAKRKIKEAGIPFEVPAAQRLGERLEAVLHVIYLIFTAGYEASQGAELIRHDLCEEALRLARVLTVLITHGHAPVPDAQRAEALGLLALLLLHHSRRRARVGPSGELVLLADQDRSLWDRAQIGAGLALLETALHMRAPGPYQIQAAISALHARSEQPEQTDWPQIAVLYGELLRWNPSPMVELNRAVAVGMAWGAERGLALVAAREDRPELRASHHLHMARADMLRRLGRLDEARASYLTARDLCQNLVERAAIARWLRTLAG